MKVEILIDLYLISQREKLKEAFSLIPEDDLNNHIKKIIKPIIKEKLQNYAEMMRNTSSSIDISFDGLTDIIGQIIPTIFDAMMQISKEDLDSLLANSIGKTYLKEIVIELSKDIRGLLDLLESISIYIDASKKDLFEYFHALFSEIFNELRQAQLEITFPE